MVFVNGLREAREINPAFEPKNILDLSDENEVFASIRPRMLRMLVDVRT